MKYYLDEDLSPRISEILRKRGIDAVSAQDVGKGHCSDFDHLSYAVEQKRCMVTRNRNDFIKLTVQFFNDNRPHFGLLIIPYTYPGDRFALIASKIKKYTMKHKEGISSYSIDFI